MSVKEPPFTIGIEEEYLLVDKDTRELASDPPASMLEDCESRCAGQVSPEFMRSQIEIGTKVCANIREAREDLARLRRIIVDVADKHGLAPIAASTHPLAHWLEQKHTPKERYNALATEMQGAARRLLICGMHVHVGIEDDTLRIDLMNQFSYFLPHLLALSTSSPFWHGRETGLKSYRTIILGNLPRAGIPPSFGSWAEYKSFIDTLVETECIDEPTKIWWDIRPNPNYPTLEYRFPDICTRVDEVVCVAALLLGVTAKLIKLRQRNIQWREYRRNLLAENKWRAVRYGTEGKLIDFGKRTEVPLRVLVHEILEEIDDVVDELEIRKEVEYVHKILEQGTSADRQLAVYHKSRDLRAVVDHVIAETKTGID